MAHADAFSRLPLPDTEVDVPTPGDVLLLWDTLSSIISAEHIRSWTDKDPTLARVRNLILSGWGHTTPDVDLQPYYNRRNELSVTNGCILWGARVVIPPQGHQLVLEQLHITHPGISRMKALSRSYVWWPGLDKTIEEKVRQCTLCQEDRPLPGKQPLHPWEWPSTPWSRIHIDHLGPFMGTLFLLVIDAHSKWMEVCIVPSTSAECTISKLKQLFAIHGLPEQIVSDNGSEQRIPRVCTV